jgi:hypothetical protein
MAESAWHNSSPPASASRLPKPPVQGQTVISHILLRSGSGAVLLDTYVLSKNPSVISAARKRPSQLAAGGSARWTFGRGPGGPGGGRWQSRRRCQDLAGAKALAALQSALRFAVYARNHLPTMAERRVPNRQSFPSPILARHHLQAVGPGSGRTPPARVELPSPPSRF